MSETGLVLSLFPGIGLLDMAFEQEGFCVVRGPDLLWGGDVRRFHPPAGRFDGVIGGPPCKRWSRMRHIVEANGYELAADLIPEFERCVSEAAPSWFLMENVMAAPVPGVVGYRVYSFKFDNHWTGVREQAVMASGGGRPVPVAMIRDSAGNHRNKTSILKNYGYQSAKGLANAKRLQCLPEDFLDDAPFTISGKFEAIGNGVPLPMGRAIAKAIKIALFHK